MDLNTSVSGEILARKTNGEMRTSAIPARSWKEVSLYGQDDCYKITAFYMQSQKTALSLLLGIFLYLPSAVAQGQAGIPIEHFIFIVQENHSFDNYFGTYPGANGIPAGVRLPDYPGGPLVSTNRSFFTTAPNIPHDLSHRWVSAVLDCHNGAMDGFMWGEWPDGYNYYGRGIPVPTPDPSLVHPRRRAGHDGQAQPASRAG